MKLFANRMASNCRRVTVYLAEKGLQLELVDVDTSAGQNRTPEFLAMNPAGLIPVLQLDDGSYLPESSAIVEYLEELHPDPPLMGTTPQSRAKVRALERIGNDLAIVCAIFFQHSHPHFAGRVKQLPDAAAAVASIVDRQLAALEQHIGTNPFLAGERLTTADITLFTTFQLIRMRLKVPFGAEYPRLNAWYERFEQRPSAAA